MDEPTADAWIAVHGAVGVVALLLGVGALAAPKRPTLHPRLGRAYLVAVAAAIGLAAPVIVARDNLFLVGMGLLVVAHGVTAWAAARHRAAPGPTGRAVALAAGVGFAAFGAWGALVAVQGSPMGAVVVGMAALGLFLVRRVRAGGDWRSLHVHGAAGALIAAVTAFAAATGPRLAPWFPEPLLWITPTLVLFPVFRRLGRSP